MKSIELKKDSWHYHVATGYSSLREWETENTDICSYTRYVLKGMFFIALIIIAASIILAPIVHLLVGIVVGLAYGAVMLSPFSMIGLLIIAISVIIGILIGSLLWYEDRNKYKVKVKKPDGYVKLAYKSWKEQYCARVEFKD